MKHTWCVWIVSVLLYGVSSVHSLGDVAANAPISIDAEAPRPHPDAEPAHPTSTAPPETRPIREEPSTDVSAASLTTPPQEALPLGIAPTQSEIARTAGEPRDRGIVNSVLENQWIRTIGSLAAVLTLIFLLRAVLMKVGRGWAGQGGRPSGVLEILARYPVGRGQTLVLLKIGRRVLLLHQTATAMITLSEVTDAAELANLLSRIEAGGRTPERGFDAALNQWAAHHDLVTPKGRIASETIDLTRSAPSGLSRLLGRRGGGL